jgi:hypothetical protein
MNKARPDAVIEELTSLPKLNPISAPPTVWGTPVRATERFLDFFDGHAVGLIVRLIILVVVSLKGKQLVSVALSDHGNVNAPFHPGS